MFRLLLEYRRAMSTDRNAMVRSLPSCTLRSRLQLRLTHDALPLLAQSLDGHMW